MQLEIGVTLRFFFHQSNLNTADTAGLQTCPHHIYLLASFIFFSVLTFAAWVVCWRIKFSTPRRFSAAKNIELAKREPKKIRNKIIKRIKNLSQQIIIFETSKKHFLTRAREKEWIYKREFVARVSTSFSRLRHWNHL